MSRTAPHFLSNRLSKALAAFVGITVLSLPLHAQAGFWNQNREGWFFYEPEPEQPEEVEKPELPEPAPSMVVTQTPEPQPQKDPGPPYLSALWLKENLPKYQRAALDNPTDIKAATVYAYLKRVAMDKAQQFTQTYQQALLRYPVLDENTNRPLASFATKVTDRAATTAQLELLKTIQSRTLGLFFFYRQDCSICEAQTAVLQWHRNKIGFDVKPISLDGSALPIAGYENYSVDHGQAKMLGIVKAPALFLVIDSNTIVSVGQGGTAVSDLNDAIIRQSLMHHVISQAEYEKTLGYQINALGESVDGYLKANNIEGEDDSGYVDPSTLFNAIRGEIGG